MQYLFWLFLAGGRPAVDPKVYAASQAEMDILCLQQPPLAHLPIPTLPQADLAFVVHHPLPGHCGTGMERSHGIPHHPRARRLGELGDAAIGADPPRWDLADGGVDAGVEGILGDSVLL